MGFLCICNLTRFFVGFFINILWISPENTQVWKADASLLFRNSFDPIKEDFRKNSCFFIYEIRGRSQTTFANFANFWPPTYLCLHWLTFELPPTYHYNCQRWHVTKFPPILICTYFYFNHQAGTTHLELQGKLKSFVLQKYKVKIKEFH